MFLKRKPDVFQLKRKRDVQGLIQALKYKRDINICLAAAQALGALSQLPELKPEIENHAIMPLIDAMGLGDAVGNNAAHALGAIGSRAVEPLIAALRDPQPFVRHYAAQALGAVGDDRAVSPLLDRLNDSEERVIVAVIDALGKIGDPRARYQLDTLTTDRRRRINMAAKRAVRRMASEQDIAPVPETPLTLTTEYESRSLIEPCVRVFVSSTFDDMRQERELLDEKVWPTLRRYCGERAIDFVEVDLRWGISQDQDLEHLTVQRCLDEVRLCDFFVAILGERYGWRPQEEDLSPTMLDPQNASDWAWAINEVKSRYPSLTELEIMQAERSQCVKFFYFRSPDYAQSLSGHLPPGEVAKYRGDPRPQDIAKMGETTAREQAEKDRNELRQLRTRLTESYMPSTYFDPLELADKILHDLREQIDRDSILRTELTSFQQAQYHQRAMAARWTRVYCASDSDRVNSPDFQALHNYVRRGGIPLAITGPAGIGKSALLANWLVEQQDVVLAYYVGPQNREPSQLLRWFLYQLQSRFDLDIDLPDGTSALADTFGDIVHQTAALCSEHLILIIDGFDRLWNEGRADLEECLRSKWPENVRVIISTREKAPDGWAEHRVKELGTRRRAAAEQYLWRYGKKLSSANLETLISADQANNPLFLRVILDELCALKIDLSQPNVDEQVRDAICEYLVHSDLDSLYSTLIKDWSQRYHTPSRPDLVSAVLSWLWASRIGLSESEITGLLADSEQIKVWNAFFRACRDHFITQSGRLTFADEALRDAVEIHYLSEARVQRAVHDELARFFKHQLTMTTPSDKIESMVWHLLQSNAWDELAAALASPALFYLLWRTDPMMVRRLWVTVERESEHTFLNTYREIIERPDRASQTSKWGISSGGDPVDGPLLSLAKPNFLYAVGQLLRERGHLEEAARLHLSAAPEDDRQNQILTLMERGHRLLADGRTTQALELYEEARRLSQQIGDQYLSMQASGNAARVYRQLGDFDRATELNREAEEVARANDFRVDLATVLTNQGNVLIDQGQLDEALHLHQQSEQIARRVDNADAIQRALGNQAVVLRRQGQVDTAETLLQKKADLCREHGLFAGLATAMYNLGRLYSDEHQDLTRATAAFSEAVKAARQAGNRPLLIISLGMHGAMLAKQGQFESALALHEEEEALCLEINDADALARSRLVQKKIRHAMSKT